MQRLKTIAAASCLALAAAFLPAHAAGDGAIWAERTQVVYDAAARSVGRVAVKVVDPEPGKNLDFVWEPDLSSLPGIDPVTHAATGKGRLVWRVRGSASYDPRTVYSTYVGEMRDGRPDGRGRLELRTGAVMEGTWKAGLLEGRGSYRDAGGSLYEGAFVAGRAEGRGRLAGRDGSIYEGDFRAGLRDGRGTTRLPGGTVYESRWRAGVEIGGGRPDVLADARIGGLLRAQAGGGDAGKVEMSVVVDPRITAQQEVQYQHMVRDQDIAIYPVSQFLNDAWNGTGTIGQDNDDFSAFWDKTYAFVEIGLESAEGARVKLDSMALDVSSSAAYRKPMLTLQAHRGCVAFRPTFNFLNYGWGDVRNARLSVRFSSPERPDEATPTYSVPLQDFSDGLDVSLEDPLKQAGVDTDALAKAHFQCKDRNQLGVCRAQLFNAVRFGEVAPFIHGDGVLTTTAKGDLDYQYADDDGNLISVEEPFEVELMMALIEVPDEVAECGDGGYPAPESMRYQEIELPVGRSDYSVSIPVRGNRNVRDFTARLKISSEMSSYHQFTATARFADGSTRSSKPISLFYIKPRFPTFESQVKLPACYLDSRFGSSC